MRLAPPIGWPNRALKGLTPGLSAYGYATGCSLAEVIEHVRNWGLWLDDGGCILVGDWKSGVEAQFRKRRYKRKPDTLTFRFPRSSSTRELFAAARKRFELNAIGYSLELTPKRQLPRALSVALDPTDVLMGQVASRLLTLTLSIDQGTPLSIGCAGRIRPLRDAPNVPLLRESKVFRAGYKVGQMVSRALRG